MRTTEVYPALAACVGALLVVGAAAKAANEPSENVARGKKVYGQLCESCHGPYGRGDGPVAASLAVKPPDFTLPDLLAGRSDAEIADGLIERSQHTPMAVARVIKPDSLRAAIAYMRTLSVPGKHVSVLAGQEVYQSFCWFCHGMKGDGKGPAAKNIKGPKPRNFTDPKFVIAGREGEIYQTITKGAKASFHGSDVMLEWGTKLSDQQVRDVIQYLIVLQKESRQP